MLRLPTTVTEELEERERELRDIEARLADLESQRDTSDSDNG